MPIYEKTASISRQQLQLSTVLRSAQKKVSSVRTYISARARGCLQPRKRAHRRHCFGRVPLLGIAPRRPAEAAGLSLVLSGMPEIYRLRARPGRQAAA